MEQLELPLEPDYKVFLAGYTEGYKDRGKSMAVYNPEGAYVKWREQNVAN